VIARELNKLHRCYTVPHARLGWLLLLIGAITWQLFGRHADWPSLLFFQKQLTQANGIVLDVTGTGFTIGDETKGAPIVSVRFEFTDPAGLQRRGRSWTESPAPKRGEQVKVEFVASQPGVNRIVDFRSGVLPLWAGSVLLFPIFGAICILKAVLFGSNQLVDCSETSQHGSKPSDARKSPVGREFES
jgi:hypothetical protein